MSRIRLRNINPTGSFNLTGSLTVKGDDKEQLENYYKGTRLHFHYY